MFADHECRKPHAERVIVHAGLPDGDFLGLPRLDRSDREGLFGNADHVASAGGSGVLGERDGVEIDHARRELSELPRGRRLIAVPPFSLERIVERPVLDVPLPALHGGAPDLVEGLGILLQVIRPGKMDIFGGHSQLGPDPIEAELHVSFREG